jgi:hypothetical protein
MSLQVQIQEADTYLSIRASGPYSFENLYNLLDKAREESEKRAKKVVILDMTEIAGTVPKLDMHELGTHFGRVWNRAIRIAIISPVGGLNKFFESVLWTKGVQVAVVPNSGAATQWMSGCP